MYIMVKGRKAVRGEIGKTRKTSCGSTGNTLQQSVEDGVSM